MDLPKGCTVAVVDGKKLALFRNEGDAGSPKLHAIPHDHVDASHKGSGARHHSSSANPDDQQIDEDGFAAGVAAYLNKEAQAGKLAKLVVIAAPRTLGELRKHYANALSSHLVGELAKELTSQSIQDIEKVISAA